MFFGKMNKAFKPFNQLIRSAPFALRVNSIITQKRVMPYQPLDQKAFHFFSSRLMSTLISTNDKFKTDIVRSLANATTIEERLTSIRNSIHLINSFYIVDAIYPLFTENDYIKILSFIGTAQLRVIFSYSGHLAAMINALPTADKNTFFHLIGKDFIATTLDISDLLHFDPDQGLSCSTCRPPSWEELKNTCDLLGYETVEKCLNFIHFKMDYVLKDLNESDQGKFINYLGNDYFNRNARYSHDLSSVLEVISSLQQGIVLSFINPIKFRELYKYLFDVTATLRRLDPSHHTFFLECLGQDHIDELTDLKGGMDPQHFVDYLKVVNTESRLRLRR